MTVGRARDRRHWILWAIAFWLTAGVVATYIWRNSLVWVQVQSYLAILISFGAWYSAETPVEEE